MISRTRAAASAAGRCRVSVLTETTRADFREAGSQRIGTATTQVSMPSAAKGPALSIAPVRSSATISTRGLRTIQSYHDQKIHRQDAKIAKWKIKKIYRRRP